MYKRGFKAIKREYKKRIAVFYRYEGKSDPGDEVTMCGIETNTNLKGILLITDGIYSDADLVKILKKLHHAKMRAVSKSSNRLNPEKESQ
jgi:hypothetical protein